MLRLFALAALLSLAAPALAANPDGPLSFTIGLGGSRAKLKYFYEAAFYPKYNYDGFEGGSLSPGLEIRMPASDQVTFLLGVSHQFAWGNDREAGVAITPGGLASARFSQSGGVTSLQAAVRFYLKP
jgi:hypothetical protein